MYKMQFIVSLNVKEHLVNPERFFFFSFEATQSSENVRTFEFRKPGLESQLLTGCDNRQVMSPTSSQFSRLDNGLKQVMLFFLHRVQSLKGHHGYKSALNGNVTPDNDPLSFCPACEIFLCHAP